jgi:RNA polymerase sigma-70 factor (ECF subfamily)
VVILVKQMKQKENIDSITLGRLALGSERALKQVIQQYNDDLLRYAFSLVKNRELAEEVVSDVFVNFWNQRTNVREILHLRRYLVTSVRNKALSEISRKKPLLDGDKVDEEYLKYSDFRSLEDDWISKELYHFIMRKIDDLPERCKEVLIMAKINGLKQKEIGDILSISPKTVENTLARALKKLHEMVEI